MPVRYDWFLAPDDTAAATALDPGHDAQGAAYRLLADTRIDPVAQAGTLEELLTGRSPRDLAEDPRWGATLATRDGGDRAVLSITDSLADALAAADPARLAAVADPWSGTEEFAGEVDAVTLGVQLRLFAGLAREARAHGGRLYCRVSRRP